MLHVGNAYLNCSKPWIDVVTPRRRPQEQIEIAGIASPNGGHVDREVDVSPRYP